ncbi:MAG: hypothetical protein ACXWJK_03125 [Burkholderiaceae bacterium]
MNQSDIKKAIYNMGGLKIASGELAVSTSAISKWIRNGVIPNLQKAKLVAEKSGFDLNTLRPPYEQVAVV